MVTLTPCSPGLDSPRPWERVSTASANLLIALLSSRRCCRRSGERPYCFALEALNMASDLAAKEHGACQAQTWSFVCAFTATAHPCRQAPSQTMCCSSCWAMCCSSCCSSGHGQGHGYGHVGLDRLNVANACHKDVWTLDTIESSCKRLFLSCKCLLHAVTQYDCQG